MACWCPGYPRRCPPPDAVGRRVGLILLVGLGIGIPMLLEFWTFTGLIRHRLFGPDEARRPSGQLPRDDRLGVGDRLFPDANRPVTVRLRACSVEAASDTWAFEVHLEVTNEGSSVSRLRLDALLFEEGPRPVPGEARRLPPESRRTVRFRRTLSPGTAPLGFVITLSEGSDGDETPITTRTIRLKTVPVRHS